MAGEVNTEDAKLQQAPTEAEHTADVGERTSILGKLALICHRAK